MQGLLIFYPSLLSLTMGKNDLSIFYADDDADDQELFKEAIAAMEGTFEVHLQNSADELLNKLENPSSVPALVFLDLNMPGKNGLEALLEIRQSEKLKDLPVIILSTSDDVKDIDEAQKRGANFFITKPLSYRTYKKAIAYSLSVNWEKFKANRQNFVYTE